MRINTAIALFRSCLNGLETGRNTQNLLPLFSATCISPCAVGFSGFWAHSCGRHCPFTEHLGWDQSTEVTFVPWFVPFRATYHFDHFGTPNPHKSHGLSSCSFILRVQTYSDTNIQTQLQTYSHIRTVIRRYSIRHVETHPVAHMSICGIACTHDRGADPRGTRTSPRRIRHCANPERCHRRKEALISSN